MKIIIIVGYTNSGKTSTLLEIIKELVSRGYEVNTVKSIHIDGFSIDQEGKDSWRHQQAGATVTATRSDVETAILYQKSMNVKELIPFFDADYLILEGFAKEKNIPRILCAKNIEEIDDRFNESVFALSGIISNEMQEYNGIKVINGLTNVKELVDLVEKKAIDSKKILDR
ncbi:MAG: molybdopterin-guanine dinucleotide biosynthesis protein B [Asgard group archaeon]|nr:molybdopterin-guanine dinucleotide biosynthesis protein B [Asgard group archaeon]